MYVLYWIGKSLFSHRLRTFILLSTLFVRCFVLCFFVFSCPQFIGIIAFSVYKIYVQCLCACMACMRHPSYSPICVPTRSLYIYVIAVVIVCTISYRRYALTVFAFILHHQHNTFSSLLPCMFLWWYVIWIRARILHAAQKAIQPRHSCCSAIHKKNRTKYERGANKIDKKHIHMHTRGKRVCVWACARAH